MTAACWCWYQELIWLPVLVLVLIALYALRFALGYFTAPAAPDRRGSAPAVTTPFPITTAAP